MGKRGRKKLKRHQLAMKLKRERVDLDHEARLFMQEYSRLPRRFELWRTK